MNPRGLARAGALLLLQPWIAGAQARPVAGQRGAAAVRTGVSVRPDTVRVGDPFFLRVRVRAPRGWTIIFPSAPDSTSTVQALDPLRLETSPDSTAVEQTAVYRLAAWDVERQPIKLPDVVLRAGGGAIDRHVAVGPVSVFVRSVLPADTAKRVPKPARALFVFTASRWWIWLIVAAAIMVTGLLLWWWWRRRSRRPTPVVTIDPYAHAEREFDRIEKLGLLQAGERGRFVALMVEVVRDYLAARYDAAALSLTSTEVLASLRGARGVPHERLARALNEADFIKFGRFPVTADRAAELAREARTIVEQEHAATTAPLEAAA